MLFAVANVLPRAISASPRPFVGLHDPVVLDQDRRFAWFAAERGETFFKAEHGEVQR